MTISSELVGREVGREVEFPNEFVVEVPEIELGVEEVYVKLILVPDINEPDGVWEVEAVKLAFVLEIIELCDDGEVETGGRVEEP